MASATNSSLMRLKNEKIILSIINREPISRADIAKRTGLTKAAVTIIADDLLKRGMVTEERSDDTVKVGRTPINLRLCADSMYFAGVNIRRGGICVGMCDLCGGVIFEDELEISEPCEAIERICSLIGKRITEHDIPKEKIYCISVATPGPVDTLSGRILNPPNFNEWHDFPLSEQMARYTDIPVILSNVSSAVAASEKYFGAARDSENFMTLLTDDGIGAGIFTGDKLFKGACEIGHISVKYDGERCECGNIGCLEKYASVPNILKGTKYRSWDECTRAGDMKIMSLEAEYLSTAIVTATNIFDLECVVLCGALAHDPEKFMSVVREKTLEKMILKKDFELRAGSVTSGSLIPCAMGLYRFFN